MELQIESPTDEIKRLRRCINDLVSVLALPAIWTGYEPSQIVITLLDTLPRMLGLDLIYLRWKGSPEVAPIEMVRVAPEWQAKPQPQEIGNLLCQWLGDDPQKWFSVVRNSFGDKEVSLVPLQLGLHGEVGVIVAGSQRADFPLQTERLVLSVAANQASIGLQGAQLLSEQKRIAGELDRRVAERTAELDEANRALREEAAERQRAENALQVRQLNLRLIVDSIPAPVALMTPDGQLESVNQPTLEYFGKTSEELKAWGTGDAVHPDDLSLAIAVWREAIETGNPYVIKERLRRFDSVYRWFDVRGFPLRDSDRRILNWCVLLTDIDDRERAEEALRASERNLSLNINAMPTLLASARPDGWGDFFNQRWLDYTGLSAEQLAGWGWATPLHPDDAERLLEIWRSSLATGAPLEAEARMRRFDGVYRWLLFRANALRDKEEKIVKWYGTAADIDQRKQAEEKLRRSEADLLEAQRLTHTGSWKHDLSSGKVTVSPETHRIFRSSPDEDTSSTEFWFGRIHPEDRQRVSELFEKCEIEKSDYEAHYRLLLPDGSVRHQHAIGRPFCNKSRDLVEFAGTAMDVTEQVEARIALQKAFNEIEKSEDQLRAIISAIPTLAWSTGPDGSADFLNERWLEYTGLTTEQAKGWGWGAAIHPDDAKGLVDYWQSSLASGTPAEAEARMRRFDGAYRWFLFRASPLRDESGSIAKWYGTNTDIDDRKRAEEALLERELNLRQITETIPEMLWSATPEGAIDYCNGRLLAYTGFSAEEVKGNGWMKVVHPDDIDQTSRVWINCVRSGSPYRLEARTIHAADNSYRWCVASALPLVDPEGRIVKWHGTVVDMHDWRIAQEELRNTQAELANVTRAMTMGQLTASIAHEVNQPLAGIVTNASTCLRMLSAEPPNLEGARETARRTIRDGNRASDVIKGLRALYSKKNEMLEPMDLNEATREVISLSLSELQRNRVVLRQELTEALPAIVGDRVQLQQVILNLLRNASDAMSTVEDRQRDLLVKTERDGQNGVQFSVKDAGVGFDPSAANRFFEAFYTTKDDGMGMGLSISRSIIESHQGRLWATKNDGPGATFCFSIPCVREAAAEARSAGVT
jgi:PAS domain S-box-containing protein